jgi:hypothetical protein
LSLSSLKSAKFSEQAGFLIRFLFALLPCSPDQGRSAAVVPAGLRAPVGRMSLGLNREFSANLAQKQGESGLARVELWELNR